MGPAGGDGWVLGKGDEEGQNTMTWMYENIMIKAITLYEN